MRCWKRIAAAIGIVLATPLTASGEVPAADCVPAYYQFDDGSGVDVSPAADGHYRWRRPDGTTGLLSLDRDGQWSSTSGWTGEDDGVAVSLAGCSSGEIRFSGALGHRLPLDSRDIRFISDGTTLAGRLVLPVGQGVVPIITLVHGSENSSALNTYALQRLLPAQGVGVFVYDKRGTGASGGAFTHDLHRLASDAQAALRTAKSLAGTRAGRVGYYGTSQGGWTAPLAAKNGDAAFVIVGYGLAVSPVEEDREALQLDMIRHGFGTAETVKALEIGRAAHAIIRSDFTSGYEGLRAKIQSYKDEPWFRFARGNMTGFMVDTPEAELREQGPRLLAGLIPDYDPMPVLRASKTPQLWILGAQDIDAPYLETYRRLQALKKHGRKFSLIVYPDAEHGLYRFTMKGGERLSTRQPASLQSLLATFASGRPLAENYDDARVER